MTKDSDQPPTERDAYQHTTDDYARPSTEIKLRPLTPEQREQAAAVAKANLAHVAKAIGEGNRELLPENLTTTGSETLLTKGQFRPLTPEEQAGSKKRMDETVASMIETMTQQNREDGFLKEQAMISEATREKIVTLGVKNNCTPVTMTLLSIWQQDNPERLKELERNGQLIPLIEDLMPALDVAQDLRAEAANQWMADHEILQMAELPLHVPTSESLD